MRNNDEKMVVVAKLESVANQSFSKEEKGRNCANCGGDVLTKLTNG